MRWSDKISAVFFRRFFMRKKTIGKLSFGPTVDITDPCYDRDVWCRMNILKHMIQTAEKSNLQNEGRKFV